MKYFKYIVNIFFGWNARLTDKKFVIFSKTLNRPANVLLAWKGKLNRLILDRTFWIIYVGVDLNIMKYLNFLKFDLHQRPADAQLIDRYVVKI